jgi:hypothetical protein
VLTHWKERQQKESRISPILFEHGAMIISGTRADDDTVLRTVGQGASFRQVEGVKLLTFIHNEEKG